MGIKGRGGRVALIQMDDSENVLNLYSGKDLNEKWTDGVSTHLGMMVNGYPNMYMV